MGLGERNSRVSTCSLGGGLHVLRYVSSDDVVAPVANLRVLSGSVEIIAAPGRAAAELSEVGTCLVLLVTGRASIEIKLTSRSAASDLEASFSIDVIDRGTSQEQLDQSHREREDGREPDRRVDQFLNGVPLRVEAHVARVGDVTVGPDEWIAGPLRPLPIEGLCVATDNAAVEVEIQVQTAGTGGHWSKWHRPGAFAGTRQRAEPLTGIRLQLVGFESELHHLAAEALFLGSPAQKKFGRYLEFASYDPLIGLKLSIAPNSAVSRIPARGEDPARVRVFRANQR